MTLCSRILQYLLISKSILRLKAGKALRVAEGFIHRIYWVKKETFFVIKGKKTGHGVSEEVCV